MTNEEFQNAVLQELKSINSRIDGINSRIDGINSRTDCIDSKIDDMNSRIDDMNSRIDGMNSRIDGIDSNVGELKDELREGLKRVETRQDEIYQVVRAIEHSNQVGRSELDSHNIRIAKVEGKLKRVAKAYNEEIEVDKASNL